MIKRLRRKSKILIIAGIVIFILATIYFVKWYSLLLIPLAVYLSLISRLRYLKRTRDRQVIGTNKGNRIIRACNREINFIQGGWLNFRYGNGRNNN